MPIYEPLVNDNGTLNMTYVQEHALHSTRQFVRDYPLVAVVSAVALGILGAAHLLPSWATRYVVGGVCLGIAGLLGRVILQERVEVCRKLDTDGMKLASYFFPKER